MLVSCSWEIIDVSKENSIIVVKYSEVFHENQHTETVFQRWPRLSLMLAVELGCISVTHAVLVLDVWKCHREQLSLGTVRSERGHLSWCSLSASWRLKPEHVMQRSWDLALWSKSMEGYWLKCSPIAVEDFIILEMIPQNSWSPQNNLHVLQRADTEKRPKHPGRV